MNKVVDRLNTVTHDRRILSELELYRILYFVRLILDTIIVTLVDHTLGKQRKMLQQYLPAFHGDLIVDNKANSPTNTSTSPIWNNIVNALFSSPNATGNSNVANIDGTYRDVTDNKTSDTSFPTCNLRDNNNTSSTNNSTGNGMNNSQQPPLLPGSGSVNRGSPLLCREDERLKTFENWPLNFIDKNTLARTGMYYLGRNDNVECYFCEVEIGRWEETDNALTEHMRWSPNCPLLRRRLTRNIPIDSELLDRVLPPASYDVCGRMEIIDVRPAAYAEGTALSATPTNNGSFVFPNHPEYAIEAARLRSFSEWPRTMRQKPQQLSEAGFFYTGIGDRVKCFSCGGGLKDWDDSDDPWEQHALWLSHCPYVKLMKGKPYIESVIAKYKPDDKTNSSNDKNELQRNNNNGVMTEEGEEYQDDEQQSHQQNNSRNNIAETTTQLRNRISSRNNSDNENVNVEDHQHERRFSLSNKSETITSKQETPQPEEKKISEEKLCKICYNAEYDTAFLPCGHVVACAKCASSVTKCPMCRKPFAKVIRVYFS